MITTLFFENKSKNNIKNKSSQSKTEKRKRRKDNIKPALIVVDMQNVFLGSTNNGIVTENCVKLIKEFHKYKLPVFLTQHHDPNPENSVLCKWFNSPIRKNTPEWELIPEIKNILSKGDILIQNKTTYDSFLGTNLNKYLIGLNVNSIVICGCMTNLCGETTARSAFCHNFNVWFPEDANGTLEEAMHLRSIENLRFGFAKICTTEKLLKIIDKRKL